MMATVPHVTSGSGLRKFLADGFLLEIVKSCSLKFHYLIIYALLILLLGSFKFVPQSSIVLPSLLHIIFHFLHSSIFIDHIL